MDCRNCRFVFVAQSLIALCLCRIVLLYLYFRFVSVALCCPIFSVALSLSFCICRFEFVAQYLSLCFCRSVSVALYLSFYLYFLFVAVTQFLSICRSVALSLPAVQFQPWCLHLPFPISLQTLQSSILIYSKPRPPKSISKSSTIFSKNFFLTILFIMSFHCKNFFFVFPPRKLWFPVDAQTEFKFCFIFFFVLFFFFESFFAILFWHNNWFPIDDKSH